MSREELLKEISETETLLATLRGKLWILDCEKWSEREYLVMLNFKGKERKYYIGKVPEFFANTTSVFVRIVGESTFRVTTETDDDKEIHSQFLKEALDSIESKAKDYIGSVPIGDPLVLPALAISMP